jgi:heme/copper-type cytochrome/quinol oxidase subunit 4
MNWKQKICLWTGIITFAFVGLVSQMGNIYAINKTPDTIVYIAKLLIRWIIIVVVTIGLIYTFKDKRDKKTKGEQKE